MIASTCISPRTTNAMALQLQRISKTDLPTITHDTASDHSSIISVDSQDITLTPKKSKSTLHLALSSPTKSFSSTATACRICHEGDTLGPLMSPCECKGTIALVHYCCLEKWLTIANSTQCEVCQYTFKVNKTPPRSMLWFRSPDSCTLYFDLICLMIFVPGGVAVSILCMQTAFAYIRDGKWEGLGLVLVTAMLIFFFAVWIYFTIRFHLRNFYEWKASHPHVHLHPSGFRMSNRS